MIVIIIIEIENHFDSFNEKWENTHLFVDVNKKSVLRMQCQCQ